MGSQLGFLATLVFLLSVNLFSFQAYGHLKSGFNITVLGAKGGIQDGNLTSFMIKPIGDNNAVTCDAGSIVNGLRVANEKGAFSDIQLPKDSPDSKIGHILKQHIKGYLISHAHLDHVMGMIVASPDDSSKPIYGLPSTIENIKYTHFNWRSWVNFGDTGAAPALNKYKYVELQPLIKQPLLGTNMQVTAFPLSHTQQSTAFLIEQAKAGLTKGSAVLCFGDTAADSVSKTDDLLKIWQAAAELVKSGALKAMVIENSYTSDRPDNLLFGHLTPKHLLQELRRFEMLAGGKGSLAGLSVIISHIKYSLLKNDKIEQTILKELTAGNDMQIKFIIPQQGDSWLFE